MTTRKPAAPTTTTTAGSTRNTTQPLTEQQQHQDDDSSAFDFVTSQMKVHLRRGSPAYNIILKEAQWQRDEYLLGQDHADIRRQQRQRQQLSSSSSSWPRRIIQQIQVNTTNIKHHQNKTNNKTNNGSSLGLQQVSHVGATFLSSSPLVKQALLPIVLQQPRTSLYQPAKRGLISLIDSQQTTVDTLLRQTILDLLEQERIRKLVMNSTKGYLADKSTM
jgi:SLT domain-containing protein